MTDLAHVLAAANAAASTGPGPQRCRFDSANPDFCLAHYDPGENDQGKTVALGDGPTGMPSWTDDFDGSRAEQYGYVNRVMADDELDEEVNRIA